MDEYPGTLKPEVTAQISSQLSKQVRDNPYAQRQFDQVTPEEVMNSRYIVYPFKELEICVYTEGAAALILAEEETAKTLAKNTGKPIVWITGLGEANEHSFAGKNQKNMSHIVSDYLGSHRAYEMAGIKDPVKTIDIVELHDAFVQQLEISLAEFGLVPYEKVDSIIEDGIMLPGGRLLVNPCGGLIYCGHAVETPDCDGCRDWHAEEYRLAQGAWVWLPCRFPQEEDRRSVIAGDDDGQGGSAAAYPGGAGQ